MGKRIIRSPAMQPPRFLTTRQKTTTRASGRSLSRLPPLPTCVISRNVFLGLALLELGENEKSEQVAVHARQMACPLIEEPAGVSEGDTGAT